MTPAELATIEALANAATPGPWRVDRGDVVADEPGVGVVGIAEVMGEHEEANAAFIAAVRQDAPALLAEVKRLQADVEYLKSRLRSPHNKRAAALMQVDSALATLARARDSAGGPLSSSDYEEFIAMIRACREPKL